MAANPIWALTVTGGFVSNFLYCVYLLNKNLTWSVFREANSIACWPLGIFDGIVVGLGA